MKKMILLAAICAMSAIHGQTLNQMLSKTEEFRTALVAAGIATVGVSIGNYRDQTTWRVDFEGGRAPTQDEAAKIVTVKTTVVTLP